ncbi:hypothetical protein SAY87_015322 [Trapa incisa]|uniref:Uncharacterized protein n=1 Tax=Trapa incisa TaxID=236973 RepID=A0AAN7GLH5_9MYRT|nr:hypothetical protein SAY87_015322 [Trapa incisa]
MPPTRKSPLAGSAVLTQQHPLCGRSTHLISKKVDSKPPAILRTANPNLGLTTREQEALSIRPEPLSQRLLIVGWAVSVTYLITFAYEMHYPALRPYNTIS